LKHTQQQILIKASIMRGMWSAGDACMIEGIAKENLL